MADLHVTSEAAGGVLTAAVLVETLSDERVCDIITEHIEDNLNDHTKSCILNLADVRFATSCGIGCMVRVHNACKARKGKFALINVDPQIASALALSKLDRLFKIAKDEDAARKSLA